MKDFNSAQYMNCSMYKNFAVSVNTAELYIRTMKLDYLKFQMFHRHEHFFISTAIQSSHKFNKRHADLYRVQSKKLR